jgi:hypothetical protein
MTKKTYRKAPRVSRSAPASGRAAHVHQQIPRARLARGYPFERHYGELQGDDEHPVDLIIGRITQIKTLDRRLGRLARRWQEQVRDAEGYRDYEDTRLLQRCLREEAFFDAGHQQGRLVGRAECLSASIGISDNARALARQVRAALATAKIPSALAATTLLELARGLVLGLQLRRSRHGNMKRTPTGHA